MNTFHCRDNTLIKIGHFEQLSNQFSFVATDLYWPNIFATNFCEFHWQNMVPKLSQFPLKFHNHAYPFCKTMPGTTTPGTYLDVAIAKNLRNSRGNCDSFATMFCQWNSRGNCDSFATIYGRETECKRRLRKYSVSITRGAPFEWAICLNVSKE